MKNNMQLQIKGIEKLFNNLDKIENQIEDEIERIIKSGAEIILDDAKSRVPKNTGDLKKSLEVKTIEIKTNQIKIGVGPVGKDVLYWYFVEYGTKKNAAQLFLR